MMQSSKNKASKAKASSDPSIVVKQLELKRLGFYTGEIDGIMGDTTKKAIETRDAKLAAEADAKTRTDEKVRTDALEKERLALEKTKLEQSGKTVDADAAETARKTKAREDRAKDAESGWGTATSAAVSAGAVPAGVAVGRGMGMGTNALLNESQTNQNKTLQGLAQDRVAGLTTQSGALNAARISGAIPPDNALLRLGAGMAPHLLLGGLMAGKGALMLSQRDPEGPYYPDQLDRAEGIGMIGAGTGIVERGVTHARAPAVPVDAQALGVIGSSQLRRNNAGASTADAGAAAAKQHLPGSRGDLMGQAQRYNIAGRSTMTTDQLRDAVGEAVKSTTAPRGGAASKMIKSLAGPAAAAGLAYAMTPDSAQAADGSPVAGNQAEALTNAGIAGGAAYGVNRLLPQAVGTALGTAGEATAPAMIDSMTDYSPDELAQGRNTLARNLPSALRGGAVEDAYQMAQVPTPGDRSDPAMMARDSAAQAQAMPMASAAGLDASAPPQAAPAAPDDFENQLAELQSLLQQIGQAQAPGPVANARDSMAVAAPPPPPPLPQRTWQDSQNRLLAR